MKTKSSFAEKVYALTSQIPKGKVSTYGALAIALNVHGASRAVGQALKANPAPIVVPCHRVVKSDGSIGGYGGAAGSEKKIKLLRSEGIKIEDGKVKKLGDVFFGEFNFSRKANQ